MNLGLNFEGQFLAHLQNLLKSRSHREVALILDSFISLHEALNIQDKEKLLECLRENLSHYTSPRTQNMLVNLLKTLNTHPASMLLFDLFLKSEFEKVKTQIMTAYVELKIDFSEDKLEEVFSAFFEGDWELRDSVLTLVIEIFARENLSVD